ncbi:MAG TPA: hypothetical protein PLC17_12080 [Tenuifilaceae bacterium]|nr:hypothetical protein [Tenuifilaceae bacterium]HPX06668.1 hypothetical protein [Tenuifilaceae bacterium]HQB79536.1 hypothetical protein [Tenuifilaceae bacterium]
MLKHQILIAFIIIGAAVWLALHFREKRRNRDFDDNSEDNNE